MNSNRDLSIIVPAKSQYIALVRDVACGFAAGIGMTIDHVDDLRLCISEAFSEILAAHAVLPITIEISANDSPQLAVLISQAGNNGTKPEPDELREQILRTLAASVELSTEADRRSIRFETRLD